MGIFDLEDTEKYPSRGPKPNSEEEDQDEQESWGNAMTIGNKDDEEYWQEVIDECFENGEFSREGVETASEYCAISFPTVIKQLDRFDVIELPEEQIKEEFDVSGTWWERTRFHEDPDDDSEQLIDGKSTERESTGLKGLVQEKKNGS
jgi:hypothetical protein